MEEEIAAEKNNVDNTILVSGFFKGSTFEAIKQATDLKRILLVSIEDKNDKDCIQLNNDTWVSVEVNQYLRERFISLQLEWNSADGKNFTTIYPVLKLPTLYFINSVNRNPILIHVGFISAATFIQKAKEALELISTPVPALNRTQLKPQPLNQITTPVLAPAQPKLAKPKSLDEENNSRVQQKLKEIKEKKKL